MRKNFNKLKQKYTLHAAIKSAVGGIAIGLIVVGALLLAFKLTGVAFAAGYYVLIGIGAALLSGAALFLVLRPSDLRLAKRLDREYALEERTQTSLEFAGEEGTILSMQREDTEERLGSLPKPGRAKAIRATLARCWTLVVLAVLAFALVIAGAIVPAKRVGAEEDPFEKPFSVSEYQLVAVQELIDNIKASELETELKDSTVAELEDLLGVLPEVDNVGDMQIAVYGAIDGVAAILKPINSYRQISTALGRAGVAYLVRATRSGTETYRGSEFLSYSQVQDFAKERVSLSVLRVQTELQDEASVLMGFAEGGNMANLIQTLNIDSANMAVALLSSGVAEDDALYVSINKFALDMQDFASTLSTESEAETVSAGLDTLFGNTAVSPMAQALSTQAYHLVVNRHVNDRLREVFELPERDEDREDEFNDDYEYEQGGFGPGPGDDDPGGNEDDDPFGGAGSQYGSDDLIYDPDTGEYVKYGDLLAKYYAIAQEYLRGGNLTPEQEAWARAYFEILFGGFTESEE